MFFFKCHSMGRKSNIPFENHWKMSIKRKKNQLFLSMKESKFFTMVNRLSGKMRQFLICTIFQHNPRGRKKPKHKKNSQLKESTNVLCEFLLHTSSIFSIFHAKEKVKQIFFGFGGKKLRNLIGVGQKRKVQHKRLD